MSPEQKIEEIRAVIEGFRAHVQPVELPTTDGVALIVSWDHVDPLVDALANLVMDEDERADMAADRPYQDRLQRAASDVVLFEHREHQAAAAHNVNLDHLGQAVRRMRQRQVAS